MRNFLPDSLWQSVSALVGVGGIVASIFLALMLRKRKTLSYEVVSSTPLLSSLEEAKGKIKILFNDAPVRSVHLIVVRFMNSGTTPIVKSDFEDPLAVRLAQNVQVLTAEVTEKNPASLHVSAEVEGQSILFPLSLLNAGDSFTAKMLVDGYDGTLNVSGRIVGVREIGKLRPRGVSPSLIVWIAVLALGLVLSHIQHKKFAVSGDLDAIFLILMIVTGFVYWMYRAAKEEAAKRKQL